MFLAVAALFCAAPLAGQTKAERKEMHLKRVAEAIARDSVKIEIVDMVPIELDMWNVAGQGFYLTVRADSVFSRMPYAGQVYTTLPGNDNGMRFEAPVTEYRKVQQSKAMVISFRTRTFEDSYLFTVDIDDEGGTEIFVQPEHKQPVTYTGRVYVEPVKRKRR